ncbi:antitrypsin-like [Dermacentor albipictus]|uniref:antitrypsin-like n=1 Tax=Dermacentor albipictus TaxID=60249 RepID=UPI0038FCABF1
MLSGGQLGESAPPRPSASCPDSAAPAPGAGREPSGVLPPGPALDPERFNEHAMALFRAALDSSPPGANVLCSPLGVVTAMAAADAPRSANREASRPCCMGDLNSVAAIVRGLLRCDALRMGNLLHVGAKTRLDDDYRKLFEGNLAGKVRRTEAASEEAAADISDSTNYWASELTDGAVTRVFERPRAEASPTAREPAKHAPSAEVTALPLEPQAACLVNLVYLNSPWEEGFKSAGNLPFYVEPARAQMVPMMTQRGAEMPYARRPSFSCLRLPYACRSAHMALFVPAIQAGGLEQDLLPAIGRWSDMRTVLEGLAWTTDITVTLPKALLESPTMDLRKCLKTLDLSRYSTPPTAGATAPNAAAEQTTGPGVAQRTPDDAASDVAAASPEEGVGGANVDDLRVEGLYHKATLDLTTRGGKSPPGFSTLLSLCSTIPANEPVRFTVDRPFVFAVFMDDFLLMVGLVRNLQSK